MACALLGLFVAVLSLFSVDDPGVVAVLYLLTAAYLSGWFVAAVLLGSATNFLTAYRQDGSTRL